MHVVATAGHVDHGKSTLVRALTGQDPDRLEEERRRGLSIQLGYCWTTLPVVGDVAFVDVPGHERFIATTLAGVGPVPVALLVVAADDPWMPQAAEHLAALDALGVRHGVLVVTRCDLADPGPALARAREELARTSLRGVPSLAVSGRTGQGLDELRATLSRVLRAVPAPDEGADVRLWVDRSFHVRGAGTVVTGTLPAGTLTVGDTLHLSGHLSGHLPGHLSGHLPGQHSGQHSGRPVRVRGLECLGEAVTSVSGVARVALELGGRAPDQIGRGSVLVTPGAFEDTALVDVRLSPGEPPPDRPLLHVGAAMVTVHVRPLSDGLARLTLREPLPLRIGDRALLRDPGSRALWGVGVLDPAPPALARRGSAARRAADLEVLDGSLTGELAVRGLAEATLLRRIGVAGHDRLPPGAVAAAGWVLSPGRAALLRARLAEEVADGGDAGLPLAAAAHRLGLPDHDLVAALVEPPLRVEAGRVVPAARSGPSTGAARALAAVRSELAADPFAAPEAGRLVGLGLDPRAVAELHRDGSLLRLADSVVLMPDAPDRAVEVLRGLEQPFTASEARRALGTSRRVVLPLLAHLDRTGRTLRLPDDRRRVR